MSDDIKNLIGKAYEKDAAGFQNAFNDIMNDKLTASISAKYDTMFTPQGEDVEIEVDTESDTLEPEQENEQ